VGPAAQPTLVGRDGSELFTGWVYDHLKPLAQELKVAHPAMLKAITASKKKNDKVDARKIADLLRCDLLPECYMAPSTVRELRRVLRYFEAPRTEPGTTLIVLRVFGHPVALVPRAGDSRKPLAPLKPPMPPVTEAKTIPGGAPEGIR
jgi:hypothetical protein